MSFVVTGNLIGAGILALPVNTGPAGLWPSLIGNVLIWAFMLTTALVLAGQKSFVENPDADLPTFFEHELGKIGKWICVAANLIILYGLLTAYLSGAASVLISLFGGGSESLFVFLFFAVATGITIFGMDIIRKGNALLMGLLWITFIFLVAMCARHVDTARFSYSDWTFLPAAIPVVVTAFHFHNLIPVLCRDLNQDQKAIRQAMFVGTFIGLVMNIMWIVVVLGALPLGGDWPSLMAAFEKNMPATIPLKDVIGSPLFSIAALMFALLAISTSYMANGTALSSFLSDLLNAKTSGRKKLAAALTFGPPLLITLVYPNVFLKALNIVGGVGIDIIFGIFPSALLLKYATGWKRTLGGLLVLVFTAILLLEIGQEMGFLDLSPDIEHWTSTQAR